MTSKSTINSYDQFAHAYSGRMRSGKNFAHLFIEKPEMSRQLDFITDLSSAKVLALGCGSGEEIELLRSKGIKDENIIGIDISSKLIEIAKQTYPEIDFRVGNMEDLSAFSSSSFDLVYSSLAMHYLELWDKVLGEISRVLKKDGQFIFSTHHPIFWGNESVEFNGDNLNLIGFSKNREDRNKVEIFGNYLTKVKREARWFEGKMRIEFFNRSISEMFTSLSSAGFHVIDFTEPKVLDEAKEKDIKLWKVNREIPMFCVWRVGKLEG